MDGERCAVGGVSAARRANSLCDIENDACEAVLVKIDFLAVRNLAYCAGFHQPEPYGCTPSSLPDIGEGGRQVSDEGSTKKRCTSESFHVSFAIHMLMLCRHFQQLALLFLETISGCERLRSWQYHIAGILVPGLAC